MFILRVTTPGLMSSCVLEVANCDECSFFHEVRWGGDRDIAGVLEIVLWGRSRHFWLAEKANFYAKF